MINPDSGHASLSAGLDPAGEFYAWERRGRGWAVWPDAVDLEPPFTPFRFHGSYPSFVQDDGQKPTLLSRFTDRLLGTPNEQRPAWSEELKDAPTAPAAAVHVGEPEELRLYLPPDSDASSEAVEQFVLGLPRLSRPVSFEVVGTAEGIAFQIACDRRDSGLIRRQLEAFVPSAVLSPSPVRLAQSWGSRASVVVEYGLSEEFMLPLRTFRRLDPDPLTACGASLQGLSPDEAGALQVLFQPVRHDWAGSILRAVLDDDGAPFFLDAPEVTSLARDKVSRPLFACIIRVAAAAASRERALEIARGIGWSLSIHANPPANHLIPLSNDGYPDDAHLADLLLRRSRRSGMLLSSAELVGFVHPPSSAIQIETLLRLRGKTRRAPRITIGHELVLGENVHGGEVSEVSLSRDQRSRHVYVVGASGTGKSTLLLNLMLQDLASGSGLALLDPHGDLVDEVLGRCPEERLDDVVLIDPADGEYPIGFNILSAHSELERTLIASDLVSVFRRLSTAWGDQMTAVLGNAILAVLESREGGTLFDLRRFLVEPAFRREFLRGVGDPEVVYFWEKEFPLLAGKPQAPLLTRLNTFLRPRAIRHMVAQRGSRLDLRKLMDGGGVLLARLSQGAIGEENAYLLGTLLVSKLHQLAISRQELDAKQRRPFYLYVDEFHNFVTPSMESILSGARKYGLGLTLAHQDLRQIQSRSPEVFNSVLSNPYTRICFRVGDHDARTLASGFAHFDERDLQGLGTGEAIARVERADHDFSLRTRDLTKIDPAVAEARRSRIVEHTRARYASTREEVEGLLQSVHAGALPEPAAQGSGAERAPKPNAPAPVSLPASAPARAKPVPSRARGGKQHTYLQELIRRWGEANGWQVTLEERVLDGLGSVDVVLRRGGASVGCEVMVTSPIEHELANLQKCLSAGLNLAISVSANEKQLRQLRALARKQLEPPLLERMHFVSPEGLFELLPLLGTGQARESTVRGYRVKVRAGRQAPGQGEAPGKAVARVLARAMKRLSRR